MFFTVFSHQRTHLIVFLSEGPLAASERHSILSYSNLKGSQCFRENQMILVWDHSVGVSGSGTPFAEADNGSNDAHRTPFHLHGSNERLSDQAFALVFGLTQEHFHS